jgi:curved DNA-binding protein CbpA
MEQLYEVLGIPRNASTKRVKYAFGNEARSIQKLAISKEEKVEKFRRLNLAYEVIKDPARRTYYNHLLNKKLSGEEIEKDDNFMQYISVAEKHLEERYTRKYTIKKSSSRKSKSKGIASYFTADKFLDLLGIVTGISFVSLPFLVWIATNSPMLQFFIMILICVPLGLIILNYSLKRIRAKKRD